MRVATPAHREAMFASTIALSAFAQGAFRTDNYRLGLLLSGLTAAVVWRSSRRTEASPLPPAEAVIDDARALSRAMIAASIPMLAILILHYLDAAYAVQISLWIVSVLVLNIPVHRTEVLPTPARLELVAVALVLLAALLLRIVGLELYPTGLHGDEGSLGQWAARIVDGERVAPFALGWDYHPTLFNYGQAAAMWWAGKTVAGDRLFSACLGGLCTIPLYTFLRRTHGHTVALATIVLQAILPWHLYFSRLAVDDIGVALCALAAMAALYRAAYDDRALAAAGTWLGLSLYFGNKAVMVPAMMVAGLAALHATGRVALLHSWRRWCLLTLVAACVAAPQLAHYARSGWYGPLLQHPLSRMVGQTTDKADIKGPLATTLHQVESSLLAFQSRPDRSIFLSFTGVPLLPPGVATLYFVGLVLCLRRARQPLPAFLLAWFVVGSLGSILTVNPPQAHHLVPMIAVPVVLAAVALAELRAALARRRWMPALMGGLVAVVTVDAGREGWQRYTVPTPWMEVTEIARALQALDRTYDVVLVTAPMAHNNGTLQFLAGAAMHAPKLYGPLREPWRGPVQRDVAFLVSWRRYDELPKLRQWYPGGGEQPYATAPGASFLTVYTVPRRVFAGE